MFAYGQTGSGKTYSMSVNVCMEAGVGVNILCMLFVTRPVGVALRVCDKPTIL